ncbi:hypothetical protein M413DRAFT_129578 [Hebeloma cylindrosporum]|uniref:Transmembrane protein n=1 Tax=Hebeloma cylindrosporum TaxID=76867 RepID=A0A0C3C040_HEBCY|nr:hypothetical protein M413DRAFT_129578 [Hebeloma cylindrosporum h7]
MDLARVLLFRIRSSLRFPCSPLSWSFLVFFIVFLLVRLLIFFALHFSFLPLSLCVSFLFFPFARRRGRRHFGRGYM